MFVVVFEQEGVGQRERWSATGSGDFGDDGRSHRDKEMRA